MYELNLGELIITCGFLFHSLFGLLLTIPTTTGFKSKKIRVMLNAPVKAESKAESADLMKHVDEDRKMLIQAVIVR